MEDSQSIISSQPCPLNLRSSYLAAMERLHWQRHLALTWLQIRVFLHRLPSIQAGGYLRHQLSFAPKALPHPASLPLTALRTSPFCLVSLTDAYLPESRLSLNNFKPPAGSRETSTLLLYCTTFTATNGFKEDRCPGFSLSNPVAIFLSSIIFQLSPIPYFLFPKFSYYL